MSHKMVAHSDGSVSTLERVTPAMAKAWLEMPNDWKRAIRQHVVARYRVDMEAGRWKTDLESSLWVMTDGTLGNGNHRIRALAQSNVAFVEMWVRRGVPQDKLLWADTGAQRTAGDILGMHSHIKYPKDVSTIVRSLHFRLWGSFGQVSAAAQREFMEEHPIVHDVAAAIRRTPGLAKVCKSTIPPSLALVFSLGSLDVRDMAEFYFRVGVGLGSDARDPAVVLRNRLAERTPFSNGDQIKSYRTVIIGRAMEWHCRGAEAKRLGAGLGDVPRCFLQNPSQRDSGYSEDWKSFNRRELVEAFEAAREAVEPGGGASGLVACTA